MVASNVDAGNQSMSDNDFQIFTKKVFTPAYDDYMELVLEAFGKNDFFTTKAEYQKITQELYNEYSSFKNSYNGLVFPNYKSFKIMDRHKIASCMVLSVAKSQPIEVNDNAKHKSNRIIMWRNAFLALSCGLNVLTMHINKEREECAKLPINISVFANILCTKEHQSKDTSEYKLGKSYYGHLPAFILRILNPEQVSRDIQPSDKKVENVTHLSNKNVIILSNIMYLLEMYATKEQ